MKIVCIKDVLNKIIKISSPYKYIIVHTFPDTLKNKIFWQHNYNNLIF